MARDGKSPRRSLHTSSTAPPPRHRQRLTSTPLFRWGLGPQCRQGKFNFESSSVARSDGRQSHGVQTLKVRQSHVVNFASSSVARALLGFTTVPVHGASGTNAMAPARREAAVAAAALALLLGCLFPLGTLALQQQLCWDEPAESPTPTPDAYVVARPGGAVKSRAAGENLRPAYARGGGQDAGLKAPTPTPTPTPTAGGKRCTGLDGLLERVAVSGVAVVATQVLREARAAGGVAATTAAAKAAGGHDADSTELTRACTCAAAAFMCKAPTAAVSRLTRQARERGMIAAPAEGEMEALCGIPCAADGPEDVCSGGGLFGEAEDAEATCVGRAKKYPLVFL